MLRLHRARRGELALGLVDADGPRAAAGEPGREVGGAAAELDRVEPVDVGERADLGLRDPPHAPARVRARPVDACAGSTHWSAVPSHSARLTSWWLMPPAPCPGRSRRPAPRRRGRGPSGSRPSPRRRGRRGAIVRTVAPRARSASVSASGGRARERAQRAEGASAWPGATRSGSGTAPRVPRRAGVASRFVGLQTPPSTYSRPPISTGAKIHGTEQDASTACADPRGRGVGRAEHDAAAVAAVDRDDPQAPVEARALGVDQAAEAGHRALGPRRGPQRGGASDGAAGGRGGERDRRERRRGGGGRAGRATGKRRGAFRCRRRPRPSRARRGPRRPSRARGRRPGTTRRSSPPRSRRSTRTRGSRCRRRCRRRRGGRASTPRRGCRRPRGRGRRGGRGASGEGTRVRRTSTAH